MLISNPGLSTYCRQSTPITPILYGYTEHIVGNQPKYEGIDRTMNKDYSVDTEGQPETRVNKYDLWCSSVANNGKEISPTEKSYLSVEQKQGRKEW